MNRINPGLATTTSVDALAPFDEFNRFRVSEWRNRPSDPKMQYEENDVALLEFMKMAPVNSNNTIKNPKINFSIDGALTTYTKAVAGIDASTTSLVIEDIGMVSADHTLFVIATGEELVIDSVTVGTSTVTLKTRGVHGPAFAIPAGAELRPGSPVIGEVGKLKDSHSSFPGDPSYNYITLSGYKFEMSVMQINAAMESDWQTWDKWSADAKYQLEIAQQNAVIWQHRGTYFDADEHQVYRGAGLMEQLSGNVLDLGSLGTNFLWGNINDYINPMFASGLSADAKDVFCGHNLWADMLTTSKQAGAMSSDVAINADYGSNQFTFHTSEGRTVNVHNVKGMNGEMANLGLVLDKSNIGGSEYDGLGPQWFLNLQANDEILRRSAGYFTSWENHIYDRSTMGVIRGGTQPLIG